MPQESSHWPLEIRLGKDKTTLTVDFDNGSQFSYPAEFLRVYSPSAEVQGHSPDQRVTVGGKRNVGIANLEPIGNYALKVYFNDGHDTGLYSWDYLYDLGANQATHWEAYLAELGEKGLSRD